jgi:hypothetical protein
MSIVSIARVSALAIAFVTPAVVQAQCTNLTGNPPPQLEEYGANFVKLKYLSTGPGGGDDRPEVKKSTFTAPSLSFDPNTLHTVHLTGRQNTIAGTTMWSLSIPPSLTLWTSTTLANGNVRWKYNDPSSAFGVKKAQVVAYVGGLHIITFVRGVNQSIVGAPLMPGVDNTHLTVEIESLGVGVCYDGTTTSCSGSGNTQTCKVD